MVPVGVTTEEEVPWLVPADEVPAGEDEEESFEDAPVELVPVELVPAEVVLLLVPSEATEESLGFELLLALLFPPAEDGVVPQEARPNKAALRRTQYERFMLVIPPLILMSEHDDE